MNTQSMLSMRNNAGVLTESIREVRMSDRMDDDDLLLPLLPLSLLQLRPMNQLLFTVAELIN